MLLLDVACELAEQRMTGINRDGERSAHGLCCQLHHLDLLEGLVAEETEHHTPLERQIAEHVLLAAYLGLDIAGMLELALVPLGIRLAVVGLAPRLVGDMHELQAVVGASRLQSGTESRELHATKGLAVDDGAGDASIDIQVAGLHMVFPIALLLLVERLQAAGETIIQAVDPGHGLLECVVGSHGQERSKEFGAEGI